MRYLTSTLIIFSLFCVVIACSEPVDEPELSPGEPTAMVKDTIKEDIKIFQDDRSNTQPFERISCMYLERMRNHEMVFKEKYIGDSMWEITLDSRYESTQFSWLVYEKSKTVENIGSRDDRKKRYC